MVLGHPSPRTCSEAHPEAGLLSLGGCPNKSGMTVGLKG